ncbi:DUF2061 domain-containing protein [Candidatus Bathyarchaeota archaeon]|nr:DUF2061 domain-containing protein [Candidatus Bathyarchaeota archaeon]NIR14027.1 DUF2061 domain-containing protein [Desulfobacterales bacterium]NIU80654.1 DUF2061 domain-containing protein [Candidatus Bathyarchaeota archaeon]NIV67275.1 DUF2061 domain-containing protein [Candidatus Bathyarchaeota archaeon]NIW15840.1 DUF2061 domain-containing protein [Candidatus Bathyarchaeota archaeon]
MNSKYRSLVKSLTWRSVGLLTLGVSSWIATGDPIATSSLTLGFNAIQIPLYYFHERLHEKLWG